MALAELGRINPYKPGEKTPAIPSPSTEGGAVGGGRPPVLTAVGASDFDEDSTPENLSDEEIQKHQQMLRKVWTQPTRLGDFSREIELLTGRSHLVTQAKEYLLTTGVRAISTGRLPDNLLPYDEYGLDRIFTPGPNLRKVDESLLNHYVITSPADSDPLILRSKQQEWELAIREKYN